MHGGVILFRGSGADARRYVEADRSRADDYYLATDATVASFTALDGTGTVISSLELDPTAYAAWVDWVNPMTSGPMGVPRLPSEGRRGSPRFAEMVVNTPKSLSVAAALHPDVSEALDEAQQDAVAQIQDWLARHSVTRVGPRRRQEVVPVERLQTVAVAHRTSRAGDPHRHVHFQIGTRVWAAGKWRGLDTAALFKQQGAIRALGTGVLAAHPGLAAVLDRHGLSLDPVTGEVAELEPFNQVMSKRGEQVRRNLDRLEADWEAEHPGESIGPVVSTRLHAQAWAAGRPAKKPTSLREEATWVSELRDAGYDPAATVRQPRPAVLLDEVSLQQVASRALDRCAAVTSTWTGHTIQEHVARIVTETGVRAAPGQLREFIELATTLASQDCFSVLPPGAPSPEHVAHLTSVRVVATETQLHDLLAARVPVQSVHLPDVRAVADALGQQLDADQLRAAAALASVDPLVVIEGAAGAGKTTMLATAIGAINTAGGSVRVVVPTKVAADVAHRELGVPAESVAALVHAHGWRWNIDGVWTRLTVGDCDPDTGHAYTGAPETARLRADERIVVDEAGMLDQSAALALLTVADEAGATVALVGDRAQLAAVGRGGVLDIAADLRGQTFDMAHVHRFTDPDYAALTVQMRDGHDLATVFDQLDRLSLIRLYASPDEVREHIAAQARDTETITVASNEEARWFNAAIRDQRITAGLLDNTIITVGNDDLPIGAGDLIQTRRNDRQLGVMNRQTWRVQHVEPDGSIWATPARNDRKHQRSVMLPAHYVAEHTHLAYASTAYGVQGATVPSSHTVLTDSLNTSAVYVGMTRGRTQNLLHIVAENLNDARTQFIDAGKRDRADRGLDLATAQAAETVNGLTDHGPVTIVNTERDRLTKLIDHANHQADWWKRASAALDRQNDDHQADSDRQRERVATAEALAEGTRAEVMAPLIEQATTDGTAYLTARERLWAASATHRAARGLSKRSAGRALNAAGKQHDALATEGRRRWERLPEHRRAIASWAADVAGQHAENDPKLTHAREHAAETQQDLQALTARQTDERADLHRKLFGNTSRPVRPAQQIRRWQKQADAARQDLSTIRMLSVADAVGFIAERAAQSQAQQETEERIRQEHIQRLEQPRGVPHRPAPPDQGIGR